MLSRDKPSLGGRREEGTRGRAALSAPLLSEIRLNSPQSLQVAYRFWISVVALSFYMRIRWIRVCGLVDWSETEQLNLHVHFVGGRTLPHSTAIQFSLAVNKTQTNPTHKVKQHPQQVFIWSLAGGKQWKNPLTHHGWISSQVKKAIQDYDTAK